MPSLRKTKRSDEVQGATDSRRRRFRKHLLEQSLYHLLSDDWGGNDTMPLGGHEALRYFDDGIEYVVAFENDAFELGFGYPDEWKLFMRRKSFHRIIRWYLWKWAWRDWFGLKRYIWYKLLHRMVNRQTKAARLLYEEERPGEHNTKAEASPNLTQRKEL